MKATGSNKTHTPQIKWDWSAIAAMYIAGLNFADITNIPEYVSLPGEVFSAKRDAELWEEQRAVFGRAKKGSILQDLKARFKKHADEYYDFMLSELHMESEIVRRRPKQGTVDDQMKRLDALTRISNLSSKVLGLDGQEMNDDAKAAYAGIINIRLAASATGSRPLLAIDTLPEHKNDFAGVLSPANAMPQDESRVMDAEFQIIEHGTAGKQEKTSAAEGKEELELAAEEENGTELSEERKEQIVKQVEAGQGEEKRERYDRKAKRAQKRGKAFIRF